MTGEPLFNFWDRPADADPRRDLPPEGVAASNGLTRNVGDDCGRESPSNHAIGQTVLLISNSG
jgi:hypothetical protein